VGELLATLDRLKLADNTLVILTSDNGPVLDDGYKDFAVEKLGDHRPAGPLRGGKYSIWEGGTRVPFVVRWPARIKPGTSDAMISQVDFCATFAALTGQKLGPDDAPDSFNVLPALLGESKTGRDHVIEHAGKLAIREGQWKFIPGGTAGKQPAAKQPAGKQPAAKRAPAGGDALFDLAKDPAEAENVAAQHPDVVERLSKKLEQVRAQGRSRPATTDN
jgi:arylsulfatase A-like enzyme